MAEGSEGEKEILPRGNARRPYRAPKVLSLGTVADLTLAGGHTKLEITTRTKA